MRALSDELRAAIDTGAIAKVIKITRTDGTVIGFTDTDMAITVDGVQYVPAPGLASIQYTMTSTTEVSNQNIEASSIDLPEEDIRSGLYDDAKIEAAWVSWEFPEAGRLVTFVGKIGTISWSNSSFKADIVDSTKQLELNIGQLYTAGCRHTLFGTAKVGAVGYCGVDASSFTFTGSVASVTKAKWSFTAALGKDDGYFDNGVITFTSGINNGLSYVVKTQVGDTFTLLLPTMGQTPVGTTFTIKAGCDKTTDTCLSKFNNIANFGGFPHVNTGVTLR